MPTYDFIDEETGEGAEVFFAIADRPKLGQVIRHEGRRLKRVMVCPNLNPIRNFEFVSRALPKENLKNPAWPCDELGRPRFKNKREVVEYTARSEGKAAWDQFEDPE